MMTDSPTDDTEAREPDAPDPTDAKHHAPLHGHTGGVPSDKALSDTNKGGDNITRGAGALRALLVINVPMALNADSNERERERNA
eukprot:scaffold14000_cov135-Isochrysis_galbana.AAC.5